jgi:hypothetical protein
MIEFLLQIAFELLSELLIIYGAESVIAPFRPAKASTRHLAFVGLFILAVFSSLVLSFMVPQRLFPTTRFRGASLLISPLLVGSAMYAFGQWRLSRGKSTTTMATFWGGAFYSFIFALTRIVYLYLCTQAPNP